jgi:hypothetical protein
MYQSDESCPVFTYDVHACICSSSAVAVFSVFLSGKSVRGFVSTVFCS